MDFEIISNANETFVDIGSQLTIFEVKALHQALLEQPKAARVILNFRRTEELDGAGVQLILCLHKQLTTADGQLQLSALSDDIRAILKSFNLLQVLLIADEKVDA